MNKRIIYVYETEPQVDEVDSIVFDSDYLMMNLHNPKGGVHKIQFGEFVICLDSVFPKELLIYRFSNNEYQLVDNILLTDKEIEMYTERP